MAKIDLQHKAYRRASRFSDNDGGCWVHRRRNRRIPFWKPTSRRSIRSVAIRKRGRLSSNVEGYSTRCTTEFRGSASAGACSPLLAAIPFVAGDDKAAVPTYIDHSRLLVYRDADNKEHPVRTKEDWLKRRKHILAGMEQAMGPLPDRAKRPPLDVQIGEKFDGRG